MLVTPIPPGQNINDHSNVLYPVKSLPSLISHLWGFLSKKIVSSDRSYQRYNSPLHQMYLSTSRLPLPNLMQFTQNSATQWNMSERTYVSRQKGLFLDLEFSSLISVRRGQPTNKEFCPGARIILLIACNELFLELNYRASQKKLSFRIF